MSETKGLIRVGRSNGCIVGDDPVLEVGGSSEIEYYGGHLVGESMSPDNARRLVVCWNACHKMPTELLEQLGTLVSSNAVPHRTLTLQRDELLAALRTSESAAHAVLIAGGDYGDDLSDHGLRKALKDARDAARAAIAKAEEVQP